MNIEIGSENVFADLGFDNANERLLKPEMARAINNILKEKKWATLYAATRLGLPLECMKRLRKGIVNDISTDELNLILKKLR